MNNAVIYCRVSTDAQEHEGTSLETQMQACLKYCQDKTYDVVASFSETYSGLTLDRPKLNELRDLIKSRTIEGLVIYSSDRLSRDPIHGVLLIQEFEQYGILLEAVTEDISTTEVG